MEINQSKDDNDIKPECYNCGSRVDAVIRIGEEPDYDALYTYVCIDCLKKAVELMEFAVKE